MSAVDRVDIARAAKRLKLKARIARPSRKQLDRLPLPAIIEKTDGSFALLAALSSGKVPLHDPQVGPPQGLERADFEALWSGYVVLVTSRAYAQGFSWSFDFSWFISEIIVMPQVVKMKVMDGNVSAPSTKGGSHRSRDGETYDPANRCDLE